MPRVGREQSGIGICHVMLRGINRQDIFEEAVRITNHSPLIYVTSGPRQMSRVSGMSYNIIQYMWKNNEEQ